MVRMLFLRDIDTDVQIRCRSCGHSGILPRSRMIDRYGPSYPVLSLAPHFRCSRCDSRDTECGPAPPAPPPKPAPQWDARDDYYDSVLAALDEPIPEPPPPPPEREARPFSSSTLNENDIAALLAGLDRIEEEDTVPVMDEEPSDFAALRAAFAPELAPELAEEPPDLVSVDAPPEEEPVALPPPPEPVEEEEDGEAILDMARLFARHGDDREEDEEPPREEDEDDGFPMPSFAIRDPEKRRPDDERQPESIEDAMAVLRGLVEDAASEPEPPRPAPLPVVEEEEPPPPPRPAREADSFENTLSKLRSLLDLDEPAPEPHPKGGGKGLFRRRR